MLTPCSVFPRHPIDPILCCSLEGVVAVCLVGFHETFCFSRKKSFILNTFIRQRLAADTYVIVIIIIIIIISIYLWMSNAAIQYNSKLKREQLQYVHSAEFSPGIHI